MAHEATKIAENARDTAMQTLMRVVQHRLFAIRITDQ